MRSAPVTAMRRSRAAVLLVAALSITALAWGCGGAKPAAPPAAAPPPAASAPAERLGPDAVLSLHWEDALNPEEALEARPDQRLRVTVAITGVDTLQGYTLQFRLEPLGMPRGDAWRFADFGGCQAATWSFTAERDARAPAPWPNKLLITDLRPTEDGTVWMLVAATWDKVILDPDSTYSLCHLDFYPPKAAEEGGRCAGWDGPARIYAERALIMLTAIEFPVQNLGGAVTVRPVAAPPSGE